MQTRTHQLNGFGTSINVEDQPQRLQHRYVTEKNVLICAIFVVKEVSLQIQNKTELITCVQKRFVQEIFRSVLCAKTTAFFSSLLSRCWSKASGVSTVLSQGKA